MFLIYQQISIFLKLSNIKHTFLFNAIPKLYINAMNIIGLSQIFEILYSCTCILNSSL